MAVKKPLVLGTDGRPQQLQAGDSLSSNAQGSVLIQSAIAAVLNPGSPVYQTGVDSVSPAIANAYVSSLVVGLAQVAIPAGNTGAVQYDGIFSQATGLWDAMAGTSGGLTAGSTYYLDPATAGNITATPPSTVGQSVFIVGVSLSTTELLLTMEGPVLL